MIQPGIYEHYKGKRYQVIGIALDEETHEPMVVYETLYENELSKLWVRKVSVFEEIIEVNGLQTPRFKFITPK